MILILFRDDNIDEPGWWVTEFKDVCRPSAQISLDGLI